MTIIVIFTGLPKFTQYAGQMWELLRERRLGAGLIADVGSRNFIVLAGNVDQTLAELWVQQLEAEGFTGNHYHTVVQGERWLDWASQSITGNWNNSGDFVSNLVFVNVRLIVHTYIPLVQRT